MSLLIPAVSFVRESARRTCCLNNMKQLGLAIQNSTDSRKRLPPIYNNLTSVPPVNDGGRIEMTFLSWRTELLPYIEQHSLFTSIDFSRPATDAANLVSLRTQIASYVCPSSTVSPLVDAYSLNSLVRGQAARSDYEIILGIQSGISTERNDRFNGVQFGPWGERQENGKFRIARMSDIADGLSNTILVAEKTQRPKWIERKIMTGIVYFGPRPPEDEMFGNLAAWGISSPTYWLITYPEVGVNDTNLVGLFSTHNGIANTVFADGSTHSIAESTDHRVLSGLITRDASDTSAFP